MARLPEIPDAVPQVSAPRPPMSAAQAGGPYMELSDALNKGAAALDTAGNSLMQNVAVPAAQIAGAQAVTRDADGNLQVDRVPIFGAAGETYNRAVKMAALTDGEAAVRMDDVAMRQKFLNDPEGYKQAAEAYREAKVEQYTDAAGPEVGRSIGAVIDRNVAQTYTGLLNDHQNITLRNVGKTLDAGIASAQNDAIALARGGIDLNDPTMQSALGKVEALTKEKVLNPRLAYPQAQADYDIAQFKGELGANRFLWAVDQTYKDKSVGADGTPNGGYQKAAEQARSILTDASLNITQGQRQAYYAKAMGELRANEAMRRQDIGMARQALQSLRMSSALGLPVDPSDVNNVANAFRAAGDPGGAAGVYATFARKSLNDDFGRQPLSDQVEQLNELRGSSRQQAAYQFFLSKGWSPEQAAGIVGGLRGETGNLNTTQIHDNGIGFGIAGWNKDRLDRLRQFAQANGKDPADLQTQLEFVDNELRTTEAAAGEKLKAAQTPEQAGQAMLSYFRPKDFDVPGAHPERAQYARMAYDAFAGGPDHAGPSPLASSPGGALWLQTNRARTIDKTAQTAWATVYSDWEKKGIRPNDAAVNQIVDAARTVGDHALLEAISAGMTRVNLAQNVSQQPLNQQQTDIAALHTAGNMGQLSPGQAAVMRDLEQRYGAITKGLKTDPISTAVANFPDQFKGPPPALDFGDPAQLQAGLQARAKIAQFAAQNWRTGPLSALDSADLAQAKMIIDGSDVGAKGMLLSALSGLPEDVRNATMAQIARSGGSSSAVALGAGSMLTSVPEIGQSILRGQMALKTDKAYWPTAAGESQAATDALNKALPPQTFPLAGRTNPAGSYATAMGMVKARYADLSAQAGDVSGKPNGERLTQAVTDVTGGVLSMNGQPLIAPVRGMPQGDFDRTIAGLTDADLPGVTTLNGAPITADYLKANGKLVSVGSGRYLVQFGNDPSHPIYAYQDQFEGAPQKFVLDLRNRPLAPADYSLPRLTQNVAP